MWNGSRTMSPFTKACIVSDVIINHAIPTMTVNQLLEVILGKSACVGGFLGDATPFQNNDAKQFSEVLEGFTIKNMVLQCILVL